MKLPLATVLVAAAALVSASVASAHAHVSPPIVVKGESQVFTLAVPTEKENAQTTKVELTPPAGFSIDSFIDSPGWKRSVEQTGSGEDAVITKVTWDGGKVPTGEATGFSVPRPHRLGEDVHVRREADVLRRLGRRLDRPRELGHAGADDPVGRLARRRRPSTVAWIALAVGVLAAVLAGVALAAGSGRRSLA